MRRLEESMIKKISYKELSFPKGLNLDLLLELVDGKTLMQFLMRHSKEERLKRRIILPSHKTIKKVFCFYVWHKIKEGNLTWEEIKAEFKAEFKSLKAINLTKFEVERLYLQRFKEILSEKK